MSKWTDANQRLLDTKIRSPWRIRKMRNRQRSGQNRTDRVVVRESTGLDGLTRKRQAIVPKESRYKSKPGGPIGPAKPGRNTGQRKQGDS